MAAPVSPGSRWRIPIVTPQPYVVPPRPVHAAAPAVSNQQPSSHEDARMRGFEDGRAYQRNGGQNMSAKADDHGHHGSGPPEGVKKALWWIGVILIAFLLFNWFTTAWDRFTDPVGFRANEQQRVIDDLKDRLRAYQSGDVGPSPRGGTGGNISRLGNNNAPRQPTAQEIWDRTFHRTTSTCAPCDQTRGWNYIQDPETCQCDAARWRPGPPPR